jgi:two-component system KDP operon response regulator KdpE
LRYALEGTGPDLKQFRILVVDDESRILNFLKLKLEMSGYKVMTAGNGPQALEMLAMEQPDLIVLDVLMPGMDGFEVLQRIRAESSVSVIILSARESSDDKVKGLQLGADDYLAKPFSPDELVARIESVRRRLLPEDERIAADVITLGHVTVDLNRHRVVIDENEIPLTRIEWLLMLEFTRNAGKLLLYDDLLTKIWGPEFRDDIQILRTWVSRLRRKIEEDPDHPRLIRTVPKTGYMIDQQP